MTQALHLTPMRYIVFICLALLMGFSVVPVRSSDAASGGASMLIPLNRSELITVGSDMAEVVIANPMIADVHIHGSRRVSVIGLTVGQTSLKIFDEKNNVMRSYLIQVGYDLPAIRKTLHSFLPGERIGVEMVNSNIALTGEVSSALVAEQAVQLVGEFVNPSAAGGAAVNVINLMKIISGQQVMLRVRVGEIKRSTLRNLGVDLQALFNDGNLGVSLFSSPSAEFLSSIGVSYSKGNDLVQGALNALEQQGLFKVLAEPNLVALSGEKAEFLAGGEFPVPTDANRDEDGVTIGIEFKPFGVAVQFVPYVLSENRIRIAVQPEVSELSDVGAISIQGVNIPAVSTRRAKTTVELAPGESFMIAGLVKDQLNSSVRQTPGVGEVPILGGLFRGTDMEREETELVIAVTPYLVDPLKSSDVRMPTDDFRPASVMEQFFYGALGSLSGDVRRLSQRPSLEGPIGFMVD